ncbi:hypothetical protein [Agaribacterium sp. ZY112]|uniref:hypothetical protein n=1 Tax=Agaribacterium sp. ZY112 TaxID=3233574 RepID=UPI00352462B0
MIKLQSPFSRPSILALGLGFGLIAGLLSINLQWQQSELDQSKIYGQALANATAREAIAPAFANDLVSLGAIVQAMATQPRVLRVAVHSAENQILVQAGPASYDLPEGHLRFEQAITLQDSIAGAVELYVLPNQPSSALSTLLGLFASFCLIYAANNIYRSRNFVWVPKPVMVSPPPTDTISKDIDSQKASQAVEQNEDDEIFEQTNVSHIIEQNQSAFVALRIKNVAVLQNQLNGSVFRSTFKLLEKRLNTIGALYGACNWRWHSDRYLIEVKANEQEQALFNAACCAKLLLDLCGILDRVPLDLSAQISLDDHKLESATMPFVGLAVDESTLSHQDLNGRVALLQYGDESAQCQLIAEFLPPYAQLLQKQMHSLKQQPSAQRA